MCIRDRYALVPILTGILKLHDSTIALIGNILDTNILCHNIYIYIYIYLAVIFKIFIESTLDSLTSVVNYLIIAFASNSWMLYVGGTLAILDQTSTTMYRSLITKTVNPDEVGKVFSIVATFQALLPFMSGPTFNYLYKYTVSYMPSAWVFLVIAIRLFNFSVLLIVNIGMRREKTRKETHGGPKYNTKKEKKMEKFVLDPN